MFSFFTKCKKSQSQRVLDELLKHGTVTSLHLSQMHPVILNFHEQIHVLRLKHNIETVIEKVNWIKHTSYIYHGRLSVPCRSTRPKKYTEEEVKAKEDKAYESGYEAARIQFTTI